MLQDCKHYGRKIDQIEEEWECYVGKGGNYNLRYCGQVRLVVRFEQTLIGKGVDLTGMWKRSIAGRGDSCVIRLVWTWLKEKEGDTRNWVVVGGDI